MAAVIHFKKKNSLFLAVPRFRGPNRPEHHGITRAHDTLSGLVQDIIEIPQILYLAGGNRLILDYCPTLSHQETGIIHHLFSGHTRQRQRIIFENIPPSALTGNRKYFYLSQNPDYLRIG